MTKQKTKERTNYHLIYDFQCYECGKVRGDRSRSVSFLGYCYFCNKTCLMLRVGDKLEYNQGGQQHEKLQNQ